MWKCSRGLMQWFIKLEVQVREKYRKFESLKIVQKKFFYLKFFGSKLVMEEIIVVYCLSAFWPSGSADQATLISLSRLLAPKQILAETAAAKRAKLHHSWSISPVCTICLGFSPLCTCCFIFSPLCTNYWHFPMCTICQWRVKEPTSLSSARKNTRLAPKHWSAVKYAT